MRGYTMLHPDVSARDARHVLWALASPRVIEHLGRLGVTDGRTVPVHAFVDDRHLVEKRLAQLLGLQHDRLLRARAALSLAARRSTSSRRWSRACTKPGIEVMLDVVYNHTAEGNQLGPDAVVSRHRQRLAITGSPRTGATTRTTTGCGNTLNLYHPRVLQMVTDSLRYWVEEMHVDGFRFDLAPTLARENDGFDHNAAFFKVLGQDPVLVARQADRRAVGRRSRAATRSAIFRPGWSEWNGQYRDTVRRYWKGDGGTAGRVRLAARRLERSLQSPRPAAARQHQLRHRARRLHAARSRLLQRQAQRRELEDNRDGTDDNASWNCGVEGPTDDPAIFALRERQKRNLMATLLLSLGVPMLLAGDEFGHTQRGNNNAYCQDNEIGWLSWTDVQEDPELVDFVRDLIELRREHPLFRRPHYFKGNAVSPSGLKDISWINVERT